jgi:hypothetical protein
MIAWTKPGFYLFLGWGGARRFAYKHTFKPFMGIQYRRILILKVIVILVLMYECIYPFFNFDFFKNPGGG